MNAKRLFTIAMMLTALAIPAEGRMVNGNRQDQRQEGSSAWEEARRVEHQDYVRREEARKRREAEAVKWTERDYRIALKIVSSVENRPFHRFSEYTKEQYEKAKLIKEAYEKQHGKPPRGGTPSR